MVTAEDLLKLKRKLVGNKKLTRSRAIRLYCKECCCAGDLKSWKECSFSGCFLYNFRLGKETLDKPSSFRKQRKIRVSSSTDHKLEEFTDAK